jgi:YfiH family protein
VFAYQDRRGAVEVAFTDRHGGVSSGPFASLNLAVPNGEDAEGHRDEVAKNLDILAHALARGAAPDRGHAAPGPDLPAGTRPPRLVLLRQVHGAAVHVARRAGARPPQEDLPAADGAVTDEPGVALVVRVADCVPVLLADVARGVVGAAHAGRPGMVAGVVPHTVDAMRDLGAERIVAWVGPHVCGRCYEVPEEMRAEVADVVPEAYAETSWGTPAVDVGAGVTAQLVAAGVEVVDAARCTLEDENLYSYRRQGASAGRMAGIVWVRP